MRFTVDTELREFAASVDAMLAARDVPAAARSWAAGKPEEGMALWSALADLGVQALLVPESAGGLDAGPVASAVTFETLGYHAVPGPLVETVAAAPALLAGSGAEDRLPEVAAGRNPVTCTWLPWVPYALDADVAALSLRVEGDSVCVLDAADGEALRSVDGARRLFDLRGAPGTAVRTGTGVRAVTARAFDTAVLAVSAQLLGLGRSLLDRSVGYAGDREQYGRPVGGFQAVKHLLADVATRLELARPLLHGAAVALANGSDESTRDVSAAKVACADAAYLAARTALQVHGAIGYTAEHDSSLALTKVRALVSAWGTQPFHRARVTAALAGTG